MAGLGWRSHPCIEWGLFPEKDPSESRELCLGKERGRGGGLGLVAVALLGVTLFSQFPSWLGCGSSFQGPAPNTHVGPTQPPRVNIHLLRVCHEPLSSVSRCSGPPPTWHGGWLGIGRMFSNLATLPRVSRSFPMIQFAKKKKRLSMKVPQTGPESSQRNTQQFGLVAFARLHSSCNWDVESDNFGMVKLLGQIGQGGQGELEGAQAEQ